MVCRLDMHKIDSATDRAPLLGVQTEAVLLGTLGALIGSLVSILGTYLANLARDHTNHVAIQPGPSAILAVFLFIGTFCVNYLRMKFPKANFACVNACVVLSFTMTEGAAIPIFTPQLAWLFLIPFALAGALSLAINYFIWPDDSMENYLKVLLKVVGSTTSFIKENSRAFLDNEEQGGTTTLPSLHTQLQGDILFMIDCKHAVQREVVYSKLSNRDVSLLSRKIKDMYPGLHGLGLSNILEKPFSKDATGAHVSRFDDTLALMRDHGDTLAQRIVACLEATTTCLTLFLPRERTTLNTILWPFPRLFMKTSSPEEMHAAAAQLTDALTDLDVSLQQCLEKQNACGLNYFINAVKPDHELGIFTSSTFGNDPTSNIQTVAGPLFLIYLYMDAMNTLGKNIAEFAKTTRDLTEQRTTRRLYWPTVSFRKWLFGRSVDATSFAANAYSRDQDAGPTDSATTEVVTNTDFTDLSLVRTRTHVDVDMSDTNAPSSSSSSSTSSSTSQLRPSTGTYRRVPSNPDVEPPVTWSEHFFDHLFHFFTWFKDIDTLMALKTALGMVLLAIPAWMPANAAWYSEWRGQWAMITLCLWSFPTTGHFYFGIYVRVLGSVIGAILGIVVWEICQGNPYALTIVSFLVFIPHYHIFFFNPVYRVASLMSKVTMVLVVIYEYDSVQAGTYEAVWTIAGKRLLLVVIGIVATAILLAIPAPVQGRIELRKRLARTIRDIGHLYGITTAEICSPSTSPLPTTNQAKAFMKLCMNIRRQIADERNLLAHSKYEPPLRGKFPFKQYTTVVQTVDNLADLVIGMAFSLRNIDGNWRHKIAIALMKERREYLASIMTTLKLISTTLASKSALPPYLLPPVVARQRFAKILEHQITLHQDDMNDPSLAPYGSYMMNGSSFVGEVQLLLEAVTELVGTEDPEVWLAVHA
ncbi:hypothetical protein BC940DRAFT_290632 [Gongronella butleri]|nr:hypothetical protein BC940DRAFT_290632 [Gongronella butleri]